MTHTSRPRLAHRHALAVLVLVAAGAAVIVAGPGLGAQAAATATAEFQTRLNDYLRLRQDLAKKLQPLSPTDARDLTSRQTRLAAAIRAVRKDARRGDLIPAGVAAQIRQIVRDDFHVRNPQVARAVFEEVPATSRAVINREFPAGGALATVPALLLDKLPRLPDNLQYRFFGRDLVILDGDTELIIDAVPDVLPAH